LKLLKLTDSAFPPIAGQAALRTLAASLLTPDVIVSSNSGQRTTPLPVIITASTKGNAVTCPVPDSKIEEWFQDLSPIEQELLVALQWYFNPDIFVPYSREFIEFAFEYIEPAHKMVIYENVRKILRRQGKLKSLKSADFIDSMDRLMVGDSP
jgi:hypothetical protein